MSSRIKEISDKFFSRDAAAKTVSEFTSELVEAETRNGSVGLELHAKPDFSVDGNDVYRFLSDRGTGRIYEGLKSLELMARTMNGVSEQSLQLFDNKIIAFTAEDMRTADEATALLIINSNIGISQIYAYAKNKESSQIPAYEAFVRSIARRIKAGTFRTENHINEALVRVKALIKTVLTTATPS